MSIVYVVQETKGINLLPAVEFGEIDILLPEGQVVFSTERTIKRLQINLRKYTFEDYLLMVGDPAAIAMAAAVASQITTGKFKLLKWDRQEKKYYPLIVNIGG
tara:strand:+ start:3615 stop:3923 length:309 start_codon:yes stop_codon:yes gene_type:complete